MWNLEGIKKLNEKADAMSNTETFGQRLKRLREAKGLTRESLGFPRIIAEIEDHGSDGSVTLQTLCTIANRLGVLAGYLLSGEPTPNTPGKRIRARRDELGWTFLECYAKLSGFSELGLAKAECDAFVDPPGAYHQEYVMLANTLGVSPEWILTGAEPKYPKKPKAPDCPLYRSFGKDIEINCNDEDSLVIVARIGCKRSDSQKILEAIRTGRAVE